MQMACNACKSPSSMVATKVDRFSGVVRAIGVIVLIPSFVGFAIAGLFFVSPIVATANVITLRSWCVLRAAHPTASLKWFPYHAGETKRTRG